MDKFNIVPDLSCHNESLTVGDAVSELMKHSLKLQRIRFNIVKKHPSMGEIVSQNMTHETIFSTDKEVDLDVNSWSATNGMRFCFFQADEVLQAEAELDEWQLEDWAKYKNRIVHIFARLDKIKSLNHDRLLNFYIYNRIIPFQFEIFRRMMNIDESIQKGDLLPTRQWILLCYDLRQAAISQITPDGLAYLVEKYLELDNERINVQQIGEKWKIDIYKEEKKEDVLLVNWLDHLFRPVTVDVEYKWKQPIDHPPISWNISKKLINWLEDTWKLWITLLVVFFIMIAASVIIQKIWDTNKNNSKVALTPSMIRIWFESESYEIYPNDTKKIDKLDKAVRILNDQPDLKVFIAGHSDNRGDYGDTVVLSQIRAYSVRRNLISRGIQPGRLKPDPKGFGAKHPIDTNDTLEGRRRNRRVEIIFHRDSDKLPYIDSDK